MPQILLYYKYVQLEKPEEITSWQKELCQRLNLKGRIIVAKEGINGTVEGSSENIAMYMEETKKQPEFLDINFKISEGTGNAFKKLSVKTRNEIVTLGKPDIFPVPDQTGASYISADELHTWFENKKDNFVILDMRNDYEHSVGKFENTFGLALDHFRDVPAHANELEKLKGKTVVAVCTGGVRCEKGTAYLKKELGFEKIYQLHDGIVTYMMKYPKGYFHGALYVFDKRSTMRTEGMEKEIIGTCMLCKNLSERFVNCSRSDCRKHCIVCENCIGKAGGEEKIVCKEKH